MKYEVLKKSYLKRNIIIGMVVVLILTAVVLTFTRAKYRVTQSVPLVSGTINFSPYDFNVVAMYLNQDGAMPSGQTKEVPKFGYTLDTEQSACFVDDVKDERIAMSYVSQTADEKAYVDFTKMSQSGTKCTVYFDLIPDTQLPTVSIATYTTDTSIRVTANANDNIGIYYYYFKINSEEEIRTEEASYTFDGLVTGSVYTVTVRVVDAAGNEASDSAEMTVGLYGGDYILAQEGGATAIEGKGTPNFASLATTDEGMYAAQDDYGTSYYYRGAVNDNWASFAGFYWRIIRVNGDGTIRLIYNGTGTNQTGDSTMISTSQVFNSSYNNNMYVGYMYTSGNAHGLGTNSSIKTALDSWYLTNLANYADKIDGNAGFCGDRTPYSGSGTGTTITYYGSYNRLVNQKTPTFKCADKDNDLYTTPGSSNGNGALKISSSDDRAIPIGLITADEISFAGGVVNRSNSNFYLYNNDYYWTMSPTNFDGGQARVFYVNGNGYLVWDRVDLDYYGVRPVINLRSDTRFEGSGTTSDPYVVVTS